MLHMRRFLSRRHIVPKKGIVMKKIVKLIGIDSWNRPIFKWNEGKEYYGSTDKLFSLDASEESILEEVTEEDLTYFGGRFGCEPMGSPATNIKIDRERNTL